jgi:uncharacterized protein with ATP-grasp and redox domains
MQSRFASKTHAKAIVFVDNAGADVCLGMIPFIRELIRRGTEVVVAANSVPSINDITALELEEQIIPFLKSDELGDATLKGCDRERSTPRRRERERHAGD